MARSSNNSPQVAIDPTDSRFMAVASRLDAPFGCALQLSGDAGEGWVTAVPIPKLPEGADTCYGSEIAFDRRGRLYYLFVGLENEGNSPMGVFMVHTDDRGISFSPPQRVLDRRRYQVRMVVDPALGPRGRLHLVWLQPNADPPTGGLPTGSNPIMSAYSDDGGTTFSDPVQVSDPARQRVVAPAVALGADHAVHVLYYDLVDDERDYAGLAGPPWEGKWSLVLSSSHDAGRTFGPGVLVDADLVPPERVMLIFTMPPAALASDGQGNLFVAWADARNDDWDVFLRHSNDGGASWDMPIRLNDDPVHNGSHQYLPRLSISPGGRVDAVFYDRRNNPENRGNDVYYTHSGDEGHSFSPNMRITSRFFDSLVGPEYTVASAEGLVEFGGRLGLVSSGRGIFAAWTDTRNTILASPAQDIFATWVEYPRKAGLAPGARAGGAALAIAALVVLVGFGRRWISPARPTTRGGGEA